MDIAAEEQAEATRRPELADPPRSARVIRDATHDDAAERLAAYLAVPDDARGRPRAEERGHSG